MKTHIKYVKAEASIFSGRTTMTKLICSALGSHSLQGGKSDTTGGKTKFVMPINHNSAFSWIIHTKQKSTQLSTLS